MRNRNAGFTLVELLVVIGIIGVLIALLLPTLKRARQAANTTVCAAQMRNIMQGLMIYAAENKGSMPYNFVWRSSSNGFSPRTTTGDYYGTKGTPNTVDYYWAQFYRWCKIVSDQNTRSTEGGLFPFNANLAQMKLDKSFICPEHLNNDYYSGVNQSYAVNPVILVNRPFELAPNGNLAQYISGTIGRTAPLNWATAGGTSWPIAPAKSGQLYGDNAVFWDTNVVDGSFTASGSWTPANCLGGFGMSSIDGGMMADPRLGYHRYRASFASTPTLQMDMPDQCILFHTKVYQDSQKGLQSAGDYFVNKDPYNGFLSPIDQLGNARFRHNGDRVCNVAFADGSVRSLTLNVYTVAYKANTTTMPLTGAIFGDVAKSDFLRRYLQIKPPANLPPEVRFNRTSNTAL